MAMDRLSRYRFTQIIQRVDGTLMLTDREPFRYQDYADNREHIAKQGDTWHSLAYRYFTADGVLKNPTDLWYVIADFQPDPVVDPTLRIEPGRVIYIPSYETLFQRILSEDRRVENR